MQHAERDWPAKTTVSTTRKRGRIVHLVRRQVALGIAATTLILGGTLVASPPIAAGSGVQVRPASAAETGAMERAAEAAHRCGFSLANEYLWPVELASDGWGLGQVDARDPRLQGNADLLLHLVAGRWRFVTCGSSFYGTHTAYPLAVVERLQAAIPAPHATTAPPAMLGALAAVVLPSGWCTGTGTRRQWPVETTDVGWASAMVGAASGRAGGCVVLYHEIAGHWHAAAHGTAPGVWTTAWDVPAFVLYVLQTATDHALHLAVG
ncbi:MAG: hypothetical protein M0T71_01880 [Actinomycetota bacterium]|nr:hypothetical protein [Actinomycetota bacterium]